MTVADVTNAMVWKRSKKGKIQFPVHLPSVTQKRLWLSSLIYSFITHEEKQRKLLQVWSSVIIIKFGELLLSLKVMVAKHGCTSFSQLTSRCLEIGWNTLLRFWYILSNWLDVELIYRELVAFDERRDSMIISMGWLHVTSWRPCRWLET